MDKLTYNEKIAVLKLLNEILHADLIVREKEVTYMLEVAESFNMHDDYTSEINLLTFEEALTMIKALVQEVKEKIALLMGKMIIIDEDINYNEVKLYHDICVSCDIDKDFDVDAYPNYNRSGGQDGNL